jgi:FlaG/FlaF family flagellin (archaellin)
MIRRNEDAVSPVVGVMLMLILTIIIATLVSGYAGGLASGSHKTPQVTIKGQFSQTNGLQITHFGGDVMPVSEMRLVIRNDESFGPGMAQMAANVINKNNLTDGNGNPLGTAFKTGDTIYLSAANSTCSALQPQENISHQDLCLDNASSIGKTFTLELEDLRGQMVTQVSVTVNP